MTNTFKNVLNFAKVFFEIFCNGIKILTLTFVRLINQFLIFLKWIRDKTDTCLILKRRTRAVAAAFGTTLLLYLVFFQSSDNSKSINSEETYVPSELYPITHRGKIGIVIIISLIILENIFSQLIRVSIWLQHNLTNVDILERIRTWQLLQEHVQVVSATNSNRSKFLLQSH